MRPLIDETTRCCSTATPAAPPASSTSSPCVRNCCLNENDICLGCARSLEDIIAWGSSSDEKKREILKRARGRKRNR